jgi:hypothetical protein
MGPDAVCGTYDDPRWDGVLATGVAGLVDLRARTGADPLPPIAASHASPRAKPRARAVAGKTGDAIAEVRGTKAGVTRTRPSARSSRGKRQPATTTPTTTTTTTNTSRSSGATASARAHHQQEGAYLPVGARVVNHGTGDDDDDGESSDRLGDSVEYAALADPAAVPALHDEGVSHEQHGHHGHHRHHHHRGEPHRHTEHRRTHVVSDTSSDDDHDPAVRKNTDDFEASMRFRPRDGSRLYPRAEVVVHTGLHWERRYDRIRKIAEGGFGSIILAVPKGSTAQYEWDDFSFFVFFLFFFFFFFFPSFAHL